MDTTERSLGRSPTFLVGTERQRHNLDQLQRREQHLAEQYHKNKPLCFSANCYQKTHPQKARRGHKDADATLVSPMLLGVADGVSQIEEYGLDASELPIELLRACEGLAMSQLIPDRNVKMSGTYRGPIPLMRDAFETTRALGSTTACIAILDNSTQIHGKLHPMIAVLSVGDCELLILRQLHGREKPYETIFHTEMQRIDGHAQCPLQICRLNEALDADFDESMPIEVIERGSAVHCVSVYEGDIVVIGSDGVFDNLFKNEIVGICNKMILPVPLGNKFVPTDPALLGQIANYIVEACHAKTMVDANGHYLATPIGKGGKVDDTSCVVGEVVEWTRARSQQWDRIRRQRQWQSIITCGGIFRSCCEDHRSREDDEENGRCSGRARDYPHGPGSSYSDGENDPDNTCSIL